MAVVETLKITDDPANIKTAILKDNPSVLPTLRMSTCPPLAVDRLIGLASGG
ncbi:MAG: XamI family restriction endonuclease [Syntrophobacteraceae bacterium]